MLAWNLSVTPYSSSLRKSTRSNRPGPVVRCHVTQFSSSRLPREDVFASYRNVKWRTPPRAKIAGKIDMSKIGKTNFFIKRDQRIGKSETQDVGFATWWM